MMSSKTTCVIVFVICAAAWLEGCGGGGDSPTSSTSTTTGTPGPLPMTPAIASLTIGGSTLNCNEFNFHNSCSNTFIDSFLILSSNGSETQYTHSNHTGFRQNSEGDMSFGQPQGGGRWAEERYWILKNFTIFTANQNWLCLAYRTSSLVPEDFGAFPAEGCCVGGSCVKGSVSACERQCQQFQYQDFEPMKISSKMFMAPDGQQIIGLVMEKGNLTDIPTGILTADAFKATQIAVV